MITNKFHLPEALVRAVENDPYEHGDANISVTGLINPPLMRYLKLRYRDQIVEDVSDRIWALLGQAVHVILERANSEAIEYMAETIDEYSVKSRLTDVLAECRLTTEVLGWKVSGTFDTYERGILSDWKVTSVYSREGKAEWTQQLNLLRVLCERNKIPVKKLQVVAIFRDWRPREATQGDYPEHTVGVIPVTMWSLDAAEAFLEERVRLHQQEKPEPCTDEERWYTGSKWALMKLNRKTAIKLYDDEETAIRACIAPGQYIEHRPGQYRRCESYCPVAPFCPLL